MAWFGHLCHTAPSPSIGRSFPQILCLSKITHLGTAPPLQTSADRELITLTRAPPGDMRLLGGITFTRDASDMRRGLSQNGSSDTVTRSELVLALKSKVVYFRSKGYQPPLSKGSAELPAMPDPVLAQLSGQSGAASRSEATGLRLTSALPVD